MSNPIERRSIDRIIEEMQIAYGLQISPQGQNLEIAEQLLPTEQTDIAKRAREIHRYAVKKETQFPARHPLLLFASYIFIFLTNQIYNFVNQSSIKHTNDVLFLANSLKNHGFINQKQFILFKQALADGGEPTKNILKDIIKELFLANRVDRKSYIHLSSLANNFCYKEVLQFLFALSSVSNIHRFSEELQGIVQPKEQLEMLEMLKEAYDHSSFPEESVQAFSTLTARLEIYRFVKNDNSTNIHKAALVETLKSKDEKAFKKAMETYLRSKQSSSIGLESESYKELQQSFKAIKAPNGFIHFSQALETLSVLQEWENKVEKLENALQGMVESKLVMDEQRSAVLLNDLKELYVIFGKILENEKESSVTPTAMGLQQGILRLRWKNIGNLIDQLNGKPEESHHLCGCMFDAEHLKVWPDVEIHEITPGSYVPARDPPARGAKKPTVLGFYCNWGNGHRAAMGAIAHSLGGKEFHIATVDLPQTAILPLDGVHQLAGGSNTITSMYNTLVAGRYWSWISFLRNSSTGTPNPETDNQYKALIREQILKERPDIITVDYGAHAHYIVAVAQELGIPCLRICTDMDMKGDVLDTEQKPDKHFKKVIPYPLEDGIEFMKTYYKDSQYAVSGYPVNPIFYKTMQEIRNNPARLSEIRAKYGIKEDEVVYMISNGGCGSDNPFPEWFAKTISGQIPKGHVFCLTGKNTMAKNYIDKYLEENIPNPDLTFHVEGFISKPEVMAELVALAAASATTGKRGLFIGKAGGGSIAEALCMGAEMLIDMREDNQIPWELYAAKQIQTRNLGDIIEQDDRFIQLVNERTSTFHQDEEYAIFREKNPETEIYDLIKTMLKEADEDSAFKARKTAWKTNSIFTRSISPQGEVLNYFDSLNTLNGMLKGLDHQAIRTPNEAIQQLREHKPAKIDFEKMELIAAHEYDRNDARLAVRYFINQLEKDIPNVPQTLDFRLSQSPGVGRSEPARISNTNEALIAPPTLSAFASAENQSLRHVGYNTRLLEAASLYLNLVNLEHYGELKQGLKSCKRDPFLMEIAYLDRLIVSKTKGAFTNGLESDPVRSAELYYKTSLAREQLRAWVGQTLKKNSNHFGLTTPLLQKEDALRSFIKYPGQYNWLADLNITQSASRFNHSLQLNEKGEVMVRFGKKEFSVSELMNSSIIPIGKRIVNSANGKEYDYRHDTGLTEATDEIHPDHWKGELPLFQRKETRKTKDFRLEIINDTTADIEHAWIRLKTPEGDVYSVGRFWDPDVSFPELERTVLLPGNLKAGDTHEFLSKKKADLRTTKIDLGTGAAGRANFNKIKTYIEKLQAGGDGFNVINQNSVSFIDDICKQIDLPVENKVTMTEYFLPVPLFMRKFFLINSWVRNISLIVLYPVTLISHMVLGIFGAFKKHFLSSPNTKPLFYSVESFFDPQTSLVSSALQLEAWQACIDDECKTNTANQVIPLPVVQSYAKRISRAKLLNTDQTA